MSTHPPRARDVDQTINSIVQEAAALTVAATLRLVSSNPNPDRPVGMVVSSDPTMPVTLALGDWCQLLSMADETPMRHKIEGTKATVALTVPQIAAACSALEGDGSDWARGIQEQIAEHTHPSFMPPSADDAPVHGIPRPVLA